MTVAEPVQTIAVGSVVAETYRVTGLLGRGGMGSVWEAGHLRLPSKRVAIKVLHADVSSDQEALARFRREAEIATRLGHPNIVEVHDFNTLPGGQPYLVLELLVGESLDARMRRGVIPPDQVVRIAGQIAGALTAAHRAGVVHRDLKPQNVFLVPREDEVGGELVKVLDFGISKIRGSQTVKTQDSTILGTPQYMAPEQATGNHAAVDQRTDVFALGAIVYEMLAGRPAFSGQSIPEVVFKVVYELPPPLAHLAPGLPARTVRAVERALAKRQDDRFPDVATFIEQLAGVSISTLRHQPMTAASPEPALAAPPDPLAATIDSGRRERPSIAPPPPPPDLTYRTRPPARRWLWISMAVSVVVGAAVTAVVMASRRDDGPQVAAPAPVASETSETDVRKLAAQAIAEDLVAEGEPLGEDHEDHGDGEEGEDHVDGEDGDVIIPDSPPVDEPPPAPAPAKKKTAPPGVQSLGPSDDDSSESASGEAKSDLVAAESALRSGDVREALYLSERAARNGAGPVALAVMARAYCASDDVGNAAAALRRIPRRKVVIRRAVRSFCTARGHDIDDD